MNGTTKGGDSNSIVAPEVFAAMSIESDLSPDPDILAFNTINPRTLAARIHVPVRSETPGPKSGLRQLAGIWALSQVVDPPKQPILRRLLPYH